MMRECPKHPGARTSTYENTCIYCTGEPPAVRGAFMHRTDRESLGEQLGVGISDRSDLDRVQRENPTIAVVESNSEEAKRRKALSAWAAMPKETRGPLPEEAKPRPPKSSRKPVDGREILRKIRQEKKS